MKNRYVYYIKRLFQKIYIYKKFITSLSHVFFPRYSYQLTSLSVKMLSFILFNEILREQNVLYRYYYFYASRIRRDEVQRAFR